MAIIDKKQKRWYAKSTFDSLDKTTIPVGTEIQVTGEIEETDLAAGLQTKINGKLTAPTTPTADSVVTMEANGTTGTKALSEFGGKLYKHMLNIKKSSGEFFVLTFLSPTSIAITNATSIDNDSNWILGATGFSSTGFACICVSLMPESGLVLFGNGNTIQILYSEVTNITDNLIES